MNNAPRARPQVGQAAPHPQRTHGPPCTFTQPYAELALAISRPMAHTRPCSRRNRAHGMTPWSSPLLFTIDSPPPGGGGGYNGANQPTTASEGNLPPACPRSGQNSAAPSASSRPHPVLRLRTSFRRARSRDLADTRQTPALAPVGTALNVL